MEDVSSTLNKEKSALDTGQYADYAVMEDVPIGLNKEGSARDTGQR